ncbi:MAG: hypothetical protein Q7S21_06290 [archaeon]|nr:hypothetical protein [archaeon]
MNQRAKKPATKKIKTKAFNPLRVAWRKVHLPFRSVRRRENAIHNKQERSNKFGILFEKAVWSQDSEFVQSAIDAGKLHLSSLRYYEPKTNLQNKSVEEFLANYREIAQKAMKEFRLVQTKDGPMQAAGINYKKFLEIIQQSPLDFIVKTISKSQELSGKQKSILIEKYGTQFIKTGVMVQLGQLQARLQILKSIQSPRGVG